MNKQGPGKIEWCDYVWNPVVGCTHGCTFCYARRQAKRQKQQCKLCYDFIPHLHAERLDEPAKRRKPARIFVCSMGELFDPAVYRIDLQFVVRAMAAAPQHTYIILTKQPLMVPLLQEGLDLLAMPNLWLGTSICNQADADARIPALLQCEAKVRFVSYEPAMGPVDFTTIAGAHVAGGRWGQNVLDQQYQSIDWLIIGFETGNRKGKVVPKREWIADAVEQAREAGVPVFVKDNVVKHFPEFAGMQEWPEGK